MSDIPRFRGNESAVAVFGGYAVHRINGQLWLYKRQELLGLADRATLAPDPLALQHVQRVMEDAEAFERNWNSLAAP